MDPLSITASIIAIGQAVVSTGTVIRAIQSFENAPVEFLVLLNDLTSLQAVLEDIKSSCDKIEAAPVNSGLKNLKTLQALEQDLRHIYAELTKLAEKFVTGINGRTRKGLPRISKIKWLKEKDNIKQLRERSRDVQMRLALAYNAIGVSQNIKHADFVFDVKGVFESSCSMLQQGVTNIIDPLAESQEAMNNMQRSMQTDIEIIKQRTDDIRLLKDELEELKKMHQDFGGARIEALVQHLIQQKEDQNAQSAALARASQQNTQGLSQMRPLITPSDPNSAKVETRAIEGITKRTSVTSLADMQSPGVVVAGTARQRCPALCKCQCHKMSRVQTPSFAQSVIGALCLQYNSIPFFGRRTCDNPRCCSKSRTLIRVQYRFPGWMVARAVCALISSHGLTDLGASIHLKVPRVIDLPDLLWSIERNDIPWLKRQILSKKLLPTDITLAGDSILTVAFFWKKWDIVRFLLEAGFDYTLQDCSGRSSICYTRTRVAVCGTQEFSSFAQATFLKLLDIDEEFEPHTTTTIHDVILGSKAMTLQQALDMEPSSIDAWDYMSYTPLHWAIIRNDAEAIEKLLSFGANVNLPTSTGMTPLHLASARGNTKVATILLEAGAKVDARDLAGNTPIHHGLRFGYDIARLLLRWGADPKARQANGDTLFHAVSQSTANRENFRSSAVALLEAGCDLEGRNEAGITPLTYAVRYAPAWSIEFIKLGARADGYGLQGDNILHHAATYWDTRQIESLRALDLTGIDPDAAANNGKVPCSAIWLRLIVKETNCYAGWTQPTLGTVLSFTCLILEIREQNWTKDLFLDSKERFLADCSHQKMRKWVHRQWDQLQKDRSLASRPWTAVDGWWFDEILDEADTETDSEWEDYDGSDVSEEADNEEQLDTEPLRDNTYENRELEASLGGDEGADADEFFDAEEFQGHSVILPPQAT